MMDDKTLSDSSGRARAGSTSAPDRRRALAVRGLSVLAAVATLAGCATPGGRPPEAGGATVPAQWQYTAAGAMAPGVDTLAGGSVAAAWSLDERWWTRFDDPALNALIDRALARNPDLAVAALRVRQAQLRAGLADSARLPSVSGRVGTDASRRVDQSAATNRSASASLSASWELDLWGRLAAQSDAAGFELQATEDDRRAVGLALVGTTAQLYWQLAYLEQRVAAGEQSLDYARRTLELVAAQHRSGRVSGLEEAQARQAVSAQQAAQSQLLQQRVEARLALALLLDEPTQTAQLPPTPVLPVGELPSVPVGVPAEVLSRRPDLRGAEARLKASFVNVDVTRTSYYPSLSLTGSLGSSSDSLSRVLSNPVGALGAALSLPFLQWRDMQRNVAISQADADAAVITFRQTLYQALSDVDQALSANTQAQVQVAAQDDRLVQARTVERLTELRYRGGAEPLKAWLDAQESRRQAEVSSAQARYEQLGQWITLVQSLGGGVPSL